MRCLFLHVFFFSILELFSPCGLRVFCLLMRGLPYKHFCGRPFRPMPSFKVSQRIGMIWIITHPSNPWFDVISVQWIPPAAVQSNAVQWYCTGNATMWMGTWSVVVKVATLLMLMESVNVLALELEHALLTLTVQGSWQTATVPEELASVTLDML